MIPQELVVFDERCQPITTSVVVAEAFGKLHKNVLRDIENLGCSEEFRRLNFELSEYTDPTGRKLPMYHIRRDGFAILAMGFTGKMAMQWKERFIAAYNALERRTAAFEAAWERQNGRVLDQIALGIELYETREWHGRQVWLQEIDLVGLSERRARDYVNVGKAFHAFYDQLLVEQAAVERVPFARFVILAKMDFIYFQVVDGALTIGPWTLPDVAEMTTKQLKDQVSLFSPETAFLMRQARRPKL